ncbi:MAG: Acyl-CoA dehydrogenase [Phycisphaerae bacterium]|nr:Acyl-CoA dehydrogenase [Phycisphaerae bacterium]
MTFELDSTQQHLAEVVRDFASRRIAPHVRAWDRAASLPDELFEELASLGLLGVMVDPAYGGAGMNLTAMTVVSEELARVDASVALAVSNHNALVCGQISAAGDEEQKRTWLPKLASGQVIGAWALTEPKVGSDAGNIQTRAAAVEGGFVLNGFKQFITNGHRAGLYVLFALTDPQHPHRGISAFIVPRNTDGLLVGPKEDKMGMRASDTVPLTLENMHVGSETLLGRLNEGFLDALRILDRARISFAAIAVGLAVGSLADALRYTQSREQFGHPLSHFQAIRFQLADMSTRIDAARLLVRRAAALQDAGRTSTRESAQAKVFAAETAVAVCTGAVQIHGGYGYLKDMAVERRMRDAKFMEIGQGTSEIMRMVISRHLLGRSAPERPGSPPPWI